MKEKIYVIPGLMTDERLWKRLIAFLEEFELVHLAIPKKIDFDEIIEEIDKEIKEPCINLIGFSMGGYIASYFAIKNPKRVKRLFLISSTPSCTNKEHIQRRREKLDFFKNNDFEKLSYEKALSLVEKKDDKELILMLIDMFNSLGKEVFLSQLEATLNRIKLEEEICNLKIPISLFYSSEDRLLNFRSLKELQNMNSTIKFISREGTSHNIPLETPLELSSYIRNWIK